MLDSTTHIETPEGVELELRLAGPMPRALAWAVDTLIRLAVYMTLSLLIEPLGKLGVSLWLISVFVLEWFYPVFFELFMDGATPGKRTMGLRVLHQDGTPVGLSASMVRNLLRFVDFLPLFYGFGFVCMLLNGEFRRLGDLAAGTFVVYTTHAASRVARADVSAAPPPVLLRRAEQRALMEFAERAPRLTPERAAELAAIVAPLTPQIRGQVRGDREANGQARVDALYAIANHLAGSS